MYPPRIHKARLSIVLRPSRPSVALHRPRSHPRPFTQNSQLLLISPTSPRPQLPFLYSPSNTFASRNVTRKRFQLQLSRLLTTERKTYIKEQAWAAAKYSIYGWTAIALVTIILFGIENERLERKFPSPTEWSWVSRWLYRSTRGDELPQTHGSGLVDWAKTGQSYRQLLERLEDTESDGKGIQPLLGADGDIYMVGVGKTGFDISSKSEPWRRGYCECLMGAARAAEHLDSWVRDKTRNLAFPPEVVIGPSNPYPKPVPYGAKPAPLEENCEPAFECPEHYYMKVLTSHGFSTRQRLNAALAYADWLEFKGLPSSAEDMYDWALDIAMGALPLDVNNVVDTKTGVINEQATYITPNILLATTALARHHAQNQNLSTALPIFLSVLRAQRNLASSLSNSDTSVSQDPLDREASVLSLLASFARSLLIVPPYPDPPPSGDIPTTRNPTTTCEEAATMAHIGEILFASSNVPSSIISHHTSLSTFASNATFAQSSGLAWTRESVALAERTLHSLSSTRGSSPSSSRPSTIPPLSLRRQKLIPDSTTARQRCTECLLSSMQNWKLMVAHLQEQEATKQGTLQRGGGRKWGWFWTGGSPEVEEGRWEREAEMVKVKSREVGRLVKDEGWMANEGARAGVLGFA